ncbi:cytochrome b [Janthinobacterium sp.]|uniref:cytochrome b n=1 Tax=Janthinobacterium sp. TaxID=1871054 RepID=UPI00293D4C9B|nr:cytochrome b [Janthinobacterium sp.]
MNQTTRKYSVPTVAIHWLMLFLLAAVYAAMELRDIFPKGSAERNAMKTWHFMLGLSVLGLVALRLVARMLGSAPPIVPAPPRWQISLAHSLHLALYSLMIGLPLLGWLLLSAAGKPVPFFGVELPALLAPDKALAEQIKEIHETFATIGYFLIGAHALAALFHHYVVRDNTLRRMLPTRD